MDTFFYILISTSLISLTAFIGVIILFLKEELLNKILLFLVAFSAGALIGGAFLHLLPETIEEVGSGEDALSRVFLSLILGFCVFFILENFIHWHHHHAKDHPEIKSFSYLILISDGVHNFIDGVIIAASFIVAFPLGVITSLAVILHELPQQLGNFGILLYSGFRKIKALLLNFLMSTFIILGGVVGFLLSEKIGDYIIYLLPFAAGNFIYIACSDLIPEIKQKESLSRSLTYFLVFLLGIGVMLFI